MITPTSAYQTEHDKPSRTPIYQMRLTVPHPIDSTLVSGLKGYWRLDEVSGVRYDAIGLGNLQDRNTVTSAAGKIGTAAQFVVGNQEYLSCALPTNSPLRTGDVDFAIGVWVYLTSKTADRIIVSQYGGSSGFGNWGWEVFYDQGNDRFRFSIRSTNNIAKNLILTSGGSPSLNTWYFIAAWHDHTADLLKGSVNDGTVDTLATVGEYPPSTIPDPFLVGADNTGSASSNQPAKFFEGRIDELSFWKKTFSAGDVTQLYNSGNGYAIPFTDPSLVNICTAHPLSGENIGLELLAPVELDRRAEIEQCRLPLSTLTVAVNDVSQQFSAITALGIPGSLCELRASFYDIAWSEASLIFTGIVSEVEHESGVYRITSRSRMAAAEDKVLFNAAKTQLTQSITASDTSFTVADATQFGPSDTIWGGAAMSVVIDDEFMFPAATQAASFSSVTRVGVNLYAVPPQMPNSQSTAHTVGSVVREFVNLGRLSSLNSDSGTNDLHPIDLLNVMLSIQGKYGIGELNIAPNIAELTAVRAALGANLKFRFQLDEAINAKKFIEEEIYLPCAMYPTENNRGELGAKLFPLTAPVSFDGSINDASITQFPKWLHNAEKRINVVIYYYDYNPVTREYTSSFEYRDETLIAENGRELPLVIYSKGIRSEFTAVVPAVRTWFGATDAFLQDAAQRHIARFGNTSPVIGVSSIFANNHMELSDDLQATFAQAIDIDTGTRQITNAPVEVAAMHHDFETGIIQIELLGYPA